MADDSSAEANTENQGSAEQPEDQIGDVQQAMEDVRRRLAEVPAEVVVVNHAMGLYELAAIHLSAESPNLPAASLAIDSVAALVDGVGDRLGENASTLRDALANIRMAFVSVNSRATAKPAEGGADDAPATDGDALGSE